MKLRLRMELISDTIFGNGESVPGGEDIAVQCDDMGFPYYNAGTFKGVFGEMLHRLLSWQGFSDQESLSKTKELLGEGKIADSLDGKQLIFSDFVLSDNVKKVMLDEMGYGTPDRILSVLSHLRTFTRIEEGMVAEGSLRSARCINKGLIFYSTIECADNDTELVKETVGLIKSIGTMRNRGFGEVDITCEEV